jgi:hypothetical protein
MNIVSAIKAAMDTLTGSSVRGAIQEFNAKAESVQTKADKICSGESEDPFGEMVKDMRGRKRPAKKRGARR